MVLEIKEGYRPFVFVHHECKHITPNMGSSLAFHYVTQRLKMQRILTYFLGFFPQSIRDLGMIFKLFNGLFKAIRKNSGVLAHGSFLMASKKASMSSEVEQVVTRPA